MRGWGDNILEPMLVIWTDKFARRPWQPTHACWLRVCTVRREQVRLALLDLRQIDFTMRGVLRDASLRLRLLWFLVSTTVHIPQEAVWALTGAAWTPSFRSTTANLNLLITDSRNPMSINWYLFLASIKFIEEDISLFIDLPGLNLLVCDP